MRVSRANCGSSRHWARQAADEALDVCHNADDSGKSRAAMEEPCELSIVKGRKASPFIPATRVSRRVTSLKAVMNCGENLHEPAADPEFRAGCTGKSTIALGSCPGHSVVGATV